MCIRHTVVCVCLMCAQVGADVLNTGVELIQIDRTCTCTYNLRIYKYTDVYRMIMQY